VDAVEYLMKRLAFMMTHPTQYHSPWFRALAARSDIDIHVFYGMTPSAEQQGAGFGVGFEWDVPLLDGYPRTILENTGSGSLIDFGGVDNPEIGRIVATQKFDAWVINGWRTRAEWRAIEACWDAKVPMFIRGDSTLTTPRSMAKKMVKWLLYRRWVPRFSCYLTVGTLNEQYYVHYGAERQRFVPVRHFVDNDWFRTKVEAEKDSVSEQRREWRIKDGALVFLFAGKFTSDKQAMDAVLAIEKARETRQDIHLVAVGDGPQRAECEAYATSRRLPVTFAGFFNQAKMPSAYAAADVLVVPSVSETWGLVVNEAMASGIPAIVSDRVGCAPDLVIHGTTGFVYPAGDTAGLAAAMGRYADSRDMAPVHGDAARQRIQLYSLDAAVDGTVTAAEKFAS
jgi:glycosyltransferase involved in cell wall biosynthesis